MQRCAFGHRATSTEVHVGHVHRNRTVLYLVRQRHFLGRPTLKPYKRAHTDHHTGDNESAFTSSVHIGKLGTGSAYGRQVGASGTGVLDSDNA